MVAAKLHASGRRSALTQAFPAQAHLPALMKHVYPYGTYEFAGEAEYARTGYQPPLRDPTP